MNWKRFLTDEIESTYRATEGIIDLVDEDALDWKPTTGENWMTTGQLLRHIADACGKCFQGFVTGDWGMPMDGEVEMLPPAHKMPSVTSIAEAKELLEADKQIALAMLDQCSEVDLAEQKITAPWDPREVILGEQLLHMIGHLAQHKTQLFYYMKLEGKPVYTGTLWGL